MNRSFLSSERIYLRAVEPEDLSVMYDMENDPSMWDVSCVTVPYSRHVLRQYIEESQCDMFSDKQLRLMIMGKQENAVLGTIDLTDFIPLHRRAEVGIALQVQYRKNGYALEALNLLCEYAFRFLRLHQLCAHVASDNQESIRLFTKGGFEQCGLLKDWIQTPEGFKDVALLQRLADSVEK